MNQNMTTPTTLNINEFLEALDESDPIQARAAEVIDELRGQIDLLKTDGRALLKAAKGLADTVADVEDSFDDE